MRQIKNQAAIAHTKAISPSINDKPILHDNPKSKLSLVINEVIKAVFQTSQVILECSLKLRGGSDSYEEFDVVGNVWLRKIEDN